MKASTETRAAITVDAGGIRLRGTFHKPQDKNSGSANVDPANRIGVLFLSAGVFPRAGSGDSAVYWAESLANSGCPSFRFDLPGLGDSDGDLLKADFDSLVNDGAFGPILSGIADQLVERFDIPGLVVVGLCAGAVTAIYSAAANQRIKGLVLLDPYFHVQVSSEVQNVLVRSHLRIVRELVWDGPLQSHLGRHGRR